MWQCEKWYYRTLSLSLYSTGDAACIFLLYRSSQTNGHPLNATEGKVERRMVLGHRKLTIGDRSFGERVVLSHVNTCSCSCSALLSYVNSAGQVYCTNCMGNHSFRWSISHHVIVTNTCSLPRVRQIDPLDWRAEAAPRGFHWVYNVSRRWLSMPAWGSQ